MSNEEAAGLPGGLVRFLAGSFLAILLLPLFVQPLVADQVPRSREQIALSFAPVVRDTSAAVVNIYTRKASRASEFDPFFSDPFFQFFFEGLNRRRAPQRQQNSLGSGVIIEGDGLIVTNHHVIEDADEVMVVLNDRREFRAEVVGADAAADLALLRIDPPATLPALPMGSSDALEVGDLVLAIGNPFGIGQTVTSGIISALSRTGPGVGSDLSFIQTDAAINPGNSGGALVTIDGKLIGVNTAIFTRGGGSIGIGFAIPIDLVKALVRSIEGGGSSLARPWLGAKVQTVTSELAANLGLDRPVGVLLNDVHRAGPARRAGLQQGDVITAVDGAEIVDNHGLNFRLAVGKLGDSASLDVWREGRVLTTGLFLELPPRDPPPEVTELDGRHALAGATVANLSPGFNQDAGLDLFAEGVVILKIDRHSPAARLGMRRGDVIASVADQPIDSVADLTDALYHIPSVWRLEIDRGGRRLGVTIGR
ncbi:MAG: Do family serine endopeptidase [Pseudomonadota bacterium]